MNHDQQPIRLSTPSDFVRLASTTFGYAPRERLVMLTFTRENRLGTCASAELARFDVEKLKPATSGAAMLALVAFTDDTELGRATLGLTAEALQVPAYLSVVVTGRTITGTAGGAPVTEEQPVSDFDAELVMRGMNIAPPTRESVMEALDEHNEDDAWAFRHAWVDESVPFTGDVAEAVRALMHADPNPVDAAALIRALDDAAALTRVFASLDAGELAQASGAFRQIAAWAFEPSMGTAYGMAALSAWVTGNGVTMVWALERAEQVAAPMTPSVQLALAVTDGALSPSWAYPLLQAMIG